MKKLKLTLLLLAAPAVNAVVPVKSPDVAMWLDLHIFTRSGLTVDLIGYDKNGNLIGQIDGAEGFFAWQPTGEDFLEGDTEWDLMLDTPIACWYPEGVEEGDY